MQRRLEVVKVYHDDVSHFAGDSYCPFSEKNIMLKDG